jgi:hypothetical protein
MTNWRTVDGKLIPIKDLTHQHLSNIFWYHRIFQDIDNMPVHLLEQVCVMAELHLHKKFNGEKLEYIPIYTYEIDWLNSLGLIKGNVIYDKWGHQVGKIISEKLKHIC